jgi:hypothetical protein
VAGICGRQGHIITTIGRNLAKIVFQAHGIDGLWRPPGG